MVQPSLHDCLALGQVEVGLRTTPARTSDHKFVVNQDEVHRLPCLLRLLQQSRPLSATASTLVGLDDSNDADENTAGKPDTTRDAVLEEAVARLEDRAALYSVAEGVQTVACHLAPAACARMSRLPPLRRFTGSTTTNRTSGPLYDTTPLQAVALDPLAHTTTAAHTKASTNKKQRRGSLSGVSTTGSDRWENDHDDLQGRSDLSDFDDDKEKDVVAADSLQTTTTTAPDKKRQKAENRRRKSSLLFTNASEDSPEFLVLQTLQEMTRLVADSLSKPPLDHTSLGLSTDDSALAEPARRADSVGGALDAADLGVTLVSLLHHAPVLRHDHVASALCRSAVPQASALMARMGANCPTAVPALLKGCIDVYQQARSLKAASIATVCGQAVRQLASLSPREAHRTLALLQRQRRSNDSSNSASGVMLDVQLELSMQHDALSACCFVMNQLGGSEATTNVPSDDANMRNKDDREPTVEENTSSEFSERSLREHLEVSNDLLNRTLSFLGEQLVSSAGIVGRECLCLTAYALLLTRVSMDQVVASAMHAREIPAWMSLALDALPGMIQDSHAQVESAPKVPPTLLPKDRRNELVVAALVATASVAISITLGFASDETQQKIADALQRAHELRRCSCVTTRILVARLALAVRFLDSEAIHNVMESTLHVDTDFPLHESRSKNLTKLCEWASLRGVFDCAIEKDIDHNTDILHPELALPLFQSRLVPTSLKTTVAKRLLSEALVDEAMARQFLSTGLTAVSCMDAACDHLSSEPIPFVLPLQMEAVAMEKDSGVPKEKVSQFFLQLLYSFSFAERNPLSPFRLDPRVLPLRQIYHRCCTCVKLEPLNSDAMSRLAQFIEASCPEVRRSHRHMNVKSRRVPSRVYKEMVSSQPTKLEYLRFMRKCIAEPTFDPCGLRMERAFGIAYEHFRDAELFAVTVSAMVSQHASPPLFFTYQMLFRDPLVVLKSPLSLWGRVGTRRVALRILTHLLEVNDIAVTTEALNDDAVEEYITSRNELVVRSLLKILCSMQKLESSRHCGMTIGILRKMMSRRGGLIATLLRQGVEESELDWMIESVPELIEDAAGLQLTLSDRSSFTAAERLVAADGILRIAVCQGYRHAKDAEMLVFMSLSQLVSSFFLIVGPVGVPVSALVSDGTGLDATQVSRKAAFRILKALEKVRGHKTRLRNEIVLSLQKFAGMCKGEFIVGSLPTAIANRQKSLLKDLLEHTGKALESLGSERDAKM